MFLPILLFLCEKGGFIFSRRGWHDMIYLELCVLCALCVELGKNLCFFHAEVADYAEIFGTVFAVAGLVASFATTEAAEAGMTGSVLVSRRDWHDLIYMELCVLCALCVE